MNTQATDYRLQIANLQDDRFQLETMIQSAYSREFAATIPHFLPQLLGVFQYDGQPIAACGLNQSSSFYLEHYLDEPMEQLASRTLGLNIERSKIIEIGNFASSPGKARLLYAGLCLTLCQSGFEYIAFTGTQHLRNSFRKVNFDPIALVEAKAERVGGDALAWGRYYDAAPQVMVASLSQARELLRQNPMLSSLFKDVPTLTQPVISGGKS